MDAWYTASISARARISYIYIFKSIYIYMYMYREGYVYILYVYAYTAKNIYKEINTCACISIHVYIYMQIRIPTKVCKYAYTYIYIYTCISMCKKCAHMCIYLFCVCLPTQPLTSALLSTVGLPTRFLTAWGKEAATANEVGPPNPRMSFLNTWSPVEYGLHLDYPKPRGP